MKPKDSYSIVDCIRDEHGDELADKFHDAFAGARIHIPEEARLTEHSQLVALMGMEDARKISRSVATSGYVSEIIELNHRGIVAAAKRKATSLLLSGQATRAVAHEVGLHERTVWRLRNTLVAQQIPEAARCFEQGMSVDEVAKKTLISVKKLRSLQDEVRSKLTASKSADLELSKK